MQEQPRHAAVDHLRAVRERIRSSRTGRLVYRFVVALLGVAITLGGLVLVPLPGPGWLIVFAGLALLATEFDPARRVLEFGRRTLQGWTAWLARQVLEFARERLRRWTAWVGRQGVAVRAGVGLGTLACVGLGLWGTAVVAGVPAWVPDAVVPPLPGLRR